MILGYIRCSTADQVKEDRSSLQTQTDIIEGFARTRGADKWGVQIFTDAGVSGAVRLASRPAGSELLAAMAPGDTVIASKLDRMFRSASDALNMLELFKERGVDLVLFDMGHEPVSAGVGKLLMTILAAVADMERIRIKERTAEGRKAKKAKGGPVGEVPFGYRKVGEGRTATMVPDEKEQEAERIMRALYKDRRIGYGDIAYELMEKGFLSRAGKPYTPTAIRRVLMREARQ